MNIKFKSLIAKLLIISLLFVSQGMCVFADSIDDVVAVEEVKEVEEAKEEIETEEKTVEEIEEEVVEEPEEEVVDEPEEDVVDEPKEIVDELEEEVVEEPEEEVVEEPEEEVVYEPEEDAVDEPEEVVDEPKEEVVDEPEEELVEESEEEEVNESEDVADKPEDAVDNPKEDEVYEPEEEVVDEPKENVVDESEVVVDETEVVIDETVETIDESKDETIDETTVVENEKQETTDTMETAESSLEQKANDETTSLINNESVSEVVNVEKSLLEKASEDLSVSELEALLEKYGLDDEVSVSDIDYKLVEENGNLFAIKDGKQFVVDKNHILFGQVANKVIFDFGDGIHPSCLRYPYKSTYCLDSENLTRMSTDIDSEDYNKYYINITYFDYTEGIEKQRQAGEIIANTFTNSAPKIVVDTPGGFGLGDHLKVPEFTPPENELPGYKFEKWVDSDNVEVTVLPLGFPYDEDLLYTAYFSVDESVKKDFTVSYKHKDGGAFGNTRDMLPAPAVVSAVAEQFVTAAYNQIIGYKLVDDNVIVTGKKRITASDEERNFDGMIEVDDDTKNIAGKMSNQDVDIEYYYEPNEEDPQTFVINYIIQATNVPIKTFSKTYVVEDLVDSSVAGSKDILGYNFLSAAIQNGTTENVDAGIYPIGTYTYDGAPAQGYEFDTTTGAFKGRMPNQSVVLNYYYEADPSVKPSVRFIQLINDGAKITTISDTTRDDVEIDTSAYFGFDKRDESNGYGLHPAVSGSGDDLVIEETNYDYSSTVPDPIHLMPGQGYIKYKSTGLSEGTIKLTYSADYTLPYWKKVSFQSDPTYGTIEKAAGTKELTERYFSKGTHKYEELVEGIVTTPVTNYMFDGWYKAASTGIGKQGDKLNLDENYNLQAAYTFFANFVEDPSCWVDLHFLGGSNGVITSATTDFHIVKDTDYSTFTFPTTNPESGYEFVGWKAQSSGNIIEANTSGTAISIGQFNSSETYTAVFQYHVDDELGVMHKPVPYCEYASNGKGEAKLFGAYSLRNYALTDLSGKVLKFYTGLEMSTGKFTDLIPGTLYNVYELANTVTLSEGDNISSVAGTDKSEASEVGVKALNNNYNVPISAVSSAINIIPVSGVQYALLDNKYNIIKEFSTETSFTNLTSGGCYIVVARESGDTRAADSQTSIQLGSVVYTEAKDLSERCFKLVIYGDGATYQCSSHEQVGTTAIGSGKIYNIKSGETVSIRGTSGYKWICEGGEVVLNSSAMQSFTMPSNDVILKNESQPTYSKSSIKVIKNGVNVNLRNPNELLEYFMANSAKAAAAVSSNYIVDFVVTLDKRPINTTDINTICDSDKVSAPYEIVAGVGMSVQGAIKEFDVPTYGFDITSVFDKEMLENINYQVYDDGVASIINCEYSYVDEQKELGSIYYSVDSTTLDKKVAISYVQLHQVLVNAVCENGTSDIVFNEIYTVEHSDKLNSIADYYEIEDMMKTQYTDSGDITSSYNSKEYNYQGIFNGTSEFNVTTTGILRNTALSLKYKINQDREDKKLLLKNTIAEANTVLGTLIYDEPIATLSEVIGQAEDVRDDQINKTVDEINQMYLDLLAAIESAKNYHPYIPPTPIPEKEYIDVYIDGNNGEVNYDKIKVVIGETFATLSNVIAKRADYDFVSWNLSADGKGDVITTSTNVTIDFIDATIYAIWKKHTKKKPTPSGGGSGGGGGGSNRTIAGVSDKVFVNPLDGTKTYDKQISYADLGFVNSILYKDNEGFLTCYEYNPAQNVFKLIIKNLNNGEKLYNQWATRVNDTLEDYDKYWTYNFDSDGNARDGFYTEGDNVYYFDRVGGDHYATLKTRWIFDPVLNNYYYSDPITGAILIGWQNIDGKYYYFSEEKAYNIEGKLDINNANAHCGYGKMLKDCVTPDGYKLDENGQRVVYEP